MVFAMQPAQAGPVPVDLLPVDPNLAIYFDVLPVDPTTAVNLTGNAHDTTSSATGTVGAATVNFAAGEHIDAANGNATIKASTDLLNSLTITIPGFTFGDFKFNVQLAGDGTGNNPPVDLTIAAYNSGGLIDSFTFTNSLVSPNANNGYFVDITGGSDMTMVILSSIIGIKEAKQFAFGDLTAICTECAPNPNSNTPLPGAVWLFGTVLAGGAGFGRWRRRRQARVVAA